MQRGRLETMLFCVADHSQVIGPASVLYYLDFECAMLEKVWPLILFGTSTTTLNGAVYVVQFMRIARRTLHCPLTSRPPFLFFCKKQET